MADQDALDCFAALAKTVGRVAGTFDAPAFYATLVIPAQAGIQTRRPSQEPQRQRLWIPACAGMTKRLA
ncbi:hypothetical protein [Sphingomonas endophytica]|uniref:Uncharacterized protein n=1 Tax=Sphingomonas endophytica TaxID=869719 RepID=A0A147I5Y1_9SPHN|nr:hypothetical protein [Sphingomonas endophytica]KTT74161.1 hypothetical protein NS334_06285 [Sphingomonas endophytica]